MRRPPTNPHFRFSTRCPPGAIRGLILGVWSKRVRIAKPAQHRRPTSSTWRTRCSAYSARSFATTRNAHAPFPIRSRSGERPIGASSSGSTRSTANLARSRTASPWLSSGSIRATGVPSRMRCRFRSASLSGSPAGTRLVARTATSLRSRSTAPLHARHRIFQKR
jgi:hypothetical protein